MSLLACPESEGLAQLATLHSGQVPSGDNPGILSPLQTMLESARKLAPATWVLISGILAIAIPTMISVARESWSTEQGGHGPIVFATGLWLLARQWPSIESVRKPGSVVVVALMLAVLVPLYVLCRITSIVEIEGYVMYATVLTVLYGWIGGAAMRMLWFPLFYLAFMLPPPETVVALVTQPLKIATGMIARTSSSAYCQCRRCRIYT